MKLSLKHGLNPTILRCPMCAKEVGLGIVGRLPDDEAAPIALPDSRPCDECQSEIESQKSKGFVIFVIRDEFQNAIRQSPWPYYHSTHAITHDAAARVFDDKSRIAGAAFLSFSLARRIGLFV